MIYFLKTTGNNLVKIGHTKFKDLDRISQIESSCPFPCELVLFIEGSLSDEKKYHSLFKNSLIPGKKEWFVYSEEVELFVTRNKENSQNPEKSLVPTRKRLKSEPVGIRFDEEKLEFIKKREKLETNQRVVDFILNDYWWKWKVPVPTAKEAPPLALKVETVVAPTPMPKVATIAPKSFLQYQAEKREIEVQEDYEKWLASVKADPHLTTKQKDLLIKYS